MRRALLLLFAAAAAGGEVNPPHPAAARSLRDPKACVGYAREVGERLLASIGTSSKRDVYHGDAGVALFFAQLFAATREPRWRDATRKVLDRALTLDSGDGLYTGRAGVGQACLDAWHATGDEKFLVDARACAARLGEPAGADVISGAAGTGIFLLNLHAATKERAHLARARRAGDFLVASAVRRDGRAHWRGRRVYLGFSHGAAGIGYFLRHLEHATGDERYGALAREAAAFVLAHEEKGARWRKYPGGPHAVQWCHGSPGIGLFFGALGDRAALDRCVAATRAEGRTARVGGCQCHGVAGNAELFLEAYRLRPDPKLLESARTFGSALLEPHGDGFRVATGTGRHRYPPGYMLGLAGIGRFFLRLAAPERTPMALLVRPA